jgi:hypothetical protein
MQRENFFQFPFYLSAQESTPVEKDIGDVLKYLNNFGAVARGLRTYRQNAKNLPCIHRFFFCAPTTAALLFFSLFRFFYSIGNLVERDKAHL